MPLDPQQECLLVHALCKQWSLDVFIPTDVIQQVLLWFGSTKDKWDPTNTSPNVLRFSIDAGACIRRIKRWDGYHYNAFGYNIIDSGQCKTWKLNIVNTKPLYTSCIQFGVIEYSTIHDDMKGSFCQMGHYNGYGAYAKNGRLFHGSYYANFSNRYKRIPSLTTGDCVSMTLDLTMETSGMVNYGTISMIQRIHLWLFMILMVCESMCWQWHCMRSRTLCV
eukprot:1082528_1